MKIKISKSQWEKIGKTTGWDKKAAIEEKEFRQYVKDQGLADYTPQEQFALLVLFDPDYGKKWSLNHGANVDYKIVKESELAKIKAELQAKEKDRMWKVEITGSLKACQSTEWKLKQIDPFGIFLSKD